MIVPIEKSSLEELIVKHISERPWSDYTEADYTLAQWHNACLIHQHSGPPTSKSQCKLPVKTPNGALNRNGVHAAAAALAGARSELKATTEEKAKAAVALRRYYSQLGETPPNSLAQSAIDHILARHGGDAITPFDLIQSGVKGMHWGVRKEEPTSSSKKVSSSPESTLAIYVATYGTIIAAYQTYRLIDSGKLHRDVPLKVNKELAKKNMSVDTINKTVVKPINPNFGRSGTKMNCRRCTFAYELRRRGLDVKATKSHMATGQDAEGLIKAINPKGSPISPLHKSIKREGKWGEIELSNQEFLKKSGKEKSDEIFKAIDKMPNRARGELTLGWKFGGGHSVAWEKVNGKAVVFDTQSGKNYDSSTMNKEFGEILHDAGITRLDNKDLNMDFLGRWVRNVD